MMVVPAVYIFSGEAGTQASGAGLMFVTLPKVFGQIQQEELSDFYSLHLYSLQRLQALFQSWKQ